MHTFSLTLFTKNHILDSCICSADKEVPSSVCGEFQRLAWSVNFNLSMHVDATRLDTKPGKTEGTDCFRTCGHGLGDMMCVCFGYESSYLCSHAMFGLKFLCHFCICSGVQRTPGIFLFILNDRTLAFRRKKYI